MIGSTGAAISCPACGKQYRWKPAVAGRRVRCGCGGIIVFPTKPPADEEVLDVAAAVASPAQPVPAQPAGRAGKSIASGAAAKSQGDSDTMKDFYWPMWLLICGVAVRFVQAIMFGELGPAAAIGGVGLNIVLSTSVLLAVMLIAAKFRGISLGRLPVAVFKLSAIAVAPGAAALLVSPMLAWLPLIGFLAMPVCVLAFQYTLLSLLFDLDESDTWYVMGVLFVVAIAIFFGMRWMMPQ